MFTKLRIGFASIELVKVYMGVQPAAPNKTFPGKLNFDFNQNEMSNCLFRFLKILTTVKVTGQVYNILGKFIDVVSTSKKGDYFSPS